MANAVSSGLSIASAGFQSGYDIMAGQAQQQQDITAAQNYLLQGSSTATNALLAGNTAAANYIYQGAAQKAQFGLEAGQYEMTASNLRTAGEFGELQSQLIDTSARQQLSTTLGNIVTVRAAGGADVTSPTTSAILGATEATSEVNRLSGEAAVQQQSAQEFAGARYAEESANFALLQGSEAQAMATANANTAQQFGAYNASTALEYGSYNATQSTEAGNIALNMGYLKSSADMLGGLAKAASNFNFPGTASG